MNLEASETMRNIFPRSSKKLRILYHGFHEVLAFDDIDLLTGLGHTVFSPLVFNTKSQNRKLRNVSDDLIDAELSDRFAKDGFNREFVSQFDVVIYIHNPADNLAGKVRQLDGAPIIYRTIGQCTNATEAALKPLQSALKIVRYSSFETRGLEAARTDAVIRFAKPIERSIPKTENGRVTTFHSGFVRRTKQSTPNVEGYNAIASNGLLDLYGSANDGMPAYRGLVGEDEQRQIYRRSSLYLFVHTVPTSYTLNFIEALAAGVPVMAPTGAYIELNTGHYGTHVDFSAERYELPELLGNDDRVLFSSVTDAKNKIARLMDDEDARREIRAAQAQVARSEFAQEVVAKDWDAFFASIL